MMNKDEEVDFIIKIIEHPARFDIGLFGILGIRSHSDGYEVSWEENGITIESTNCAYKDFSSVKEAAIFFVNKRYEYEVGLDFEVAGMKAQLIKVKNE